MIRASDIMTENVEVIYPDMEISDLAHLMLRERVSGFPVVSEGLGIIGVVTITDLFRLISEAVSKNKEGEFFDEIRSLKSKTVAEIMTRDVVTLPSETNLVDLVNIMSNRGIHFFPIVEDKKICGVVSRHDILNAVFSYEME